MTVSRFQVAALAVYMRRVVVHAGVALCLLERHDVRFFTALRRKAGLAPIKPEPIAQYVFAHPNNCALTLWSQTRNEPCCLLYCIRLVCVACQYGYRYRAFVADAADAAAAAAAGAGARAGEIVPSSSEDPSERCKRCLAELASVLRHESVSLLRHGTVVQPLAMARPISEANDDEASNNESLTNARQQGGAWGTQLWDLQRKQIASNISMRPLDEP